ncbi:MAG: AAA family ATPase [Bdellovibrionota bacterium]
MYQRQCNILKDMSFLLLGARGTGKTWLLEEHFKSSSLLWINLLENKEFFKYHKNPDLLRQEIASAIKNTKQNWVIIDEVQRVPQLLNEVHSLIEDRELASKNIKFGLSGSSARKLKRGGANLLAGRALLNNLFPLTSIELGKDFDLNTALTWGMLPGVINQKNPLVKTELLETYIAVYLREEIREEQLVRNLDPFSRFLDVAAQSSGKIINYAKIGRDCNVDSRAVARYFQILEETLLGIFLAPYHRSVRKQQGKSPKFYFFDIGVIRTLEGNLSNTIIESSYGYGRLFEHFFIWEIIKLNEYTRSRHKLSYLITKDNVEVDLIIERKTLPPILIEIKSGKDPKINDARHLLAMKPEFPKAEIWVVSRIEREREESGVRFLNWQTALKNLF